MPDWTIESTFTLSSTCAKRNRAGRNYAGRDHARRNHAG
jgi:hypothetical protein